MIYVLHKESIFSTLWAGRTIVSYASVARPYLTAVFRKDVHLKLVPFPPTG